MSKSPLFVVLLIPSLYLVAWIIGGLRLIVLGQPVTDCEFLCDVDPRYKFKPVIYGFKVIGVAVTAIVGGYIATRLLSRFYKS